MGTKLWRRLINPMRRVWLVVAVHVGIRKTGLTKLKYEVKTCEYEDVHVLWEMLKKNETGSPNKFKKRCFWNFCDWARLPYPSRGF